MNEPTMETLEGRLDRVERENRRLKRAGVVALAVIAAVVLMGQATGSKVVEAQKFVVKDADGTVRAILGEGKSHIVDSPVQRFGLHLYGSNGKDRASLAEWGEDGTGLVLYDKQLRTTAKLITLATGENLNFASLSLDTHEKGLEEQYRLEAEIWKKVHEGKLDQQSAFAQLSPISSSKTSVSLSAGGRSSNVTVGGGEPGKRLRGTVELDSSRGNPRITLTDKNGKERVYISMWDAPIVQLMDQKGTRRALLEVDSDGHPHLALYDKDDKIRAELGTTSLETSRTGAIERRPESSLVLFDKKGKVIWSAPSAALP